MSADRMPPLVDWNQKPTMTHGGPRACPKCATEVGTDANYCWACGHLLQAKPGTTEDDRAGSPLAPPESAGAKLERLVGKAVRESEEGAAAYADHADTVTHTAGTRKARDLGRSAEAALYLEATKLQLKSRGLSFEKAMDAVMATREGQELYRLHRAGALPAE